MTILHSPEYKNGKVVWKESPDSFLDMFDEVASNVQCGGETRQKYAHMMSISKECRELAKKHNVPIITAKQCNGAKSLDKL